MGHVNVVNILISFIINVYCNCKCYKCIINFFQFK